MVETMPCSNSGNFQGNEQFFQSEVHLCDIFGLKERGHTYQIFIAKSPTTNLIWVADTTSTLSLFDFPL